MEDWDDAFAADCDDNERALVVAQLAEAGHRQHGRGEQAGAAQQARQLLAWAPGAGSVQPALDCRGSMPRAARRIPVLGPAGTQVFKGIGEMQQADLSWSRLGRGGAGCSGRVAEQLPGPSCRRTQQ